MRCGRAGDPSLNGDGVMLRQLLLRGLGQRQLQDAVLKFGVDVGGLDAVAHIKAAAALAGVTLLPDVAALLVLLVPVQALGGADGQVAVLQVKLDLVLLEAGRSMSSS